MPGEPGLHRMPIAAYRDLLANEPLQLRHRPASVPIPIKAAADEARRERETGSKEWPPLDAYRRWLGRDGRAHAEDDSVPKRSRPPHWPDFGRVGQRSATHRSGIGPVGCAPLTHPTE